MPSAGLLDLVAHGVQDIYLIGNPQMTFFKAVYKRHTNFVMESVQGTFDGTQNWGNRIVCRVPRTGDLLHTVIVEFDLPELVGTGSDSQNSISYIPNVGQAIIEYVELKIGGQTIDKQYGEWMYIWNELTLSDEKKRAFYEMTKSEPRNGPFTCFVPLQLWFCRNIGNALPLVALQYHDVDIEIVLRPLDQLYYFGQARYYDLTSVPYTGPIIPPPANVYTRGTSGQAFTPSINGKILVFNNGTTSMGTPITYLSPTEIALLGDIGATGNRVYISPGYTLVGSPTITDIRIYLDYVYLDTYERKYFAQAKHRYLIEQIQATGQVGISPVETSTKISLDFNLPVKELFWTVQTNENLNNNELLNFLSTPDPVYERATDIITSMTITYNGSQRFSPRSGEYFRLIQPYQHHTNPGVFDKYIYVYSFALHPEELQPSGASNYSKIDTVDFQLQLNQTHPPSVIRIYALNYNVLRIMNGMGGIAFLN